MGITVDLILWDSARLSGANDIHTEKLLLASFSTNSDERRVFKLKDGTICRGRFDWIHINENQVTVDYVLIPKKGE